MHAGLVAALEATEEVDLLGDIPIRQPQVKLVDFEIPEPEPPVEPVEPEPAEPAPPEKARPQTPPPPRTEPPPAKAPSPPPPAARESTESAAPGPPAAEAPGGVVQMENLAPAGTIPAAVGTSRRSGPGGSGRGTGGGGKEDAPGQGAAPPGPVSVAAIKRPARPIGDVDHLIARDYPAEARRLEIGGEVKVKLIVDADGLVREQTLIKRRGHGLDQYALRLAKKLRFEPALDESDRPVASVVVWTFDFEPP